MRSETLLAAIVATSEAIDAGDFYAARGTLGAAQSEFLAQQRPGCDVCRITFDWIGLLWRNRDVSGHRWEAGI